MLGATGTIGSATARTLRDRGHDVVCMLRPRPTAPAALDGFTIRYADPNDPAAVAATFSGDVPFDAVVSCMASRTGAPADAWAVDHDAHVVALNAAQAAGVGSFILLSAICVQKPKLAFQHAKLAFEDKLIRSGLAYAIVRPTAYFKSLSGQIARV
ncbi:MAG: NAD(P)H-binding protein, partial [Pseudomonadota bacterium]